MRSHNQPITYSESTEVNAATLVFAHYQTPSSRSGKEQYLSTKEANCAKFSYYDLCCSWSIVDNAGRNLHCDGAAGHELPSSTSRRCRHSILRVRYNVSVNAQPPPFHHSLFLFNSKSICIYSYQRKIRIKGRCVIMYKQVHTTRTHTYSHTYNMHADIQYANAYV